MKKGVIRAIILLAIFVVFVAGFSIIFNRKTTEKTRDLGVPELPVAYMKIGEASVNRMFGYRQEMDVATMRDGLTLLTPERQLTFQIAPYGNAISSVMYEVTSADGSQLVENGKIQALSENGELKEASFQLATPILMDQEYALRFEVKLEGEEQPVYYYTRIIQRSGVNVSNYVEFVQNFYEKCFDKEAAKELNAYIEPNDTGSNSSFHNVTIHSSLDQISWGTLSPTVEKRAVPMIKEINETTVSIAQEYIISARDTEGNTEYYQVTEFYRMRDMQSRVALLDFERSATQIFDAGLPVLTSTGISLGVVGRDVQYLSNSGADIVAFVVNGELWSYNRSANKCTRIFGFRNTEVIDERAEHAEHDIKIVRVSESGDISFVVYGYMNGDAHEGMSGCAVYHYTADSNLVREELFIPSASSYQTLRQNLSVFSYVSTQDKLYLYIETNLYEIDLASASYKIVKDSIAPDCFVVSKSQASVAWMDEMSEYGSTHITAMSLETGQTLQISAEEGQKIRALGFINEDLVCGVANDSDILTDAAGNVTFAMNSLTIRNFSGETVKEYRQDGIYVTQVNIQEGLLELERAVREGDGFTATSNDHIMNNLMDNEETVSVKQSVSERKGAQISLVFTKTGKTRNLMVLDTKLVDAGKIPTLTIETPHQDTEQYYVYAKGGLLDVSTKVGEAIRLADENMGVVLNRRQQYVWERGNQKTSIKLDPAAIPQGLLTAPLDEATIQSAVGENGTVMNLTGCTLSSVLYQISSGYPVMARNGEGSSVLILGYDQYNIWMYNPADQSLYPGGLKDSTALFESMGNVFMSYRDA